MPNEQWFLSLPPCSAQVPCGGHEEHVLSWAAGQLQLPAHPDAEAELVLAALGGEQAGCVRLAQTWGRHTGDLTVLEVSSRGPDDTIRVGWHDMPADPAGWQAGQQTMPGPAMAGPLRFPMRPGYGPAQSRQAMAAQLKEYREKTVDMLSLLALGPAFGARLTGHVVAAHAGRLTAANRPALHAALEGRLARVAEDWIGIDPDQVRGSLHEASGWGSLALTGKGTARELHIALPAGWLASVWAPGLALVGRRLVVAVTQPGWPDAQVLALRAPGTEPVLLDVHGTAGSGDTAHWET